jgi:hypothetical protein
MKADSMAKQPAMTATSTTVTVIESVPYLGVSSCRFSATPPLSTTTPVSV